MKTKEELNAIKEEVEALSKKFAELTDDELKQLTGGITIPQPYCVANQQRAGYAPSIDKYTSTYKWKQTEFDAVTSQDKDIND